MPTLDDIFASAKAHGFGVLVINTLHTGDVINAGMVAGGDIDASTTTTTSLTIPREALSLSGRNSAVAIGESGPCALADPNFDPFAWRVRDMAQRSAQWQQEYAAASSARWQVIDQR